MKRKTNKEFIIDAKKIHNDKYDYSLVNYINAKTKVKIICPKHGIFEQIPNDHLSKYGCKYCSNNIKKSVEEFISECKKIHGEKYDYSLVKYKNNRNNIKIICPEHGIFEQKPYNHLNGQGCSVCSGIKKLDVNDFIEKSKKIHGEKYDYSLVEYKNNKTKVKILCIKHGVFEQRPYNHMNKCGCPICSDSKGERSVREFLENNNIKFEIQKAFNGCKYKRKLKFDFYLPDYNICIEYDGEQHFGLFRFEKNDNRLKERILRDNIKNDFCKNNSIELIRIKYNENISDKILYLIK